MVFDYKIVPVQKEWIDSPNAIRGFSERRRTITRRFKKDRRRSKADRRSSVRDGVFVNFSFENNRRRGGDRRRARPVQPFNSGIVV
ncbi:MAG: hypothetical protein MI749_00810 [Desulfovibrionales bacterium]|nr:hypothetical protein [Desulfovibrionales bacterium]